MDEIRALFKITGPDLDRDEIIVGRQGLRIGRAGDNTMVLNHRELSRQHLRILWREDDRYQVEDLNSSNGSWLNDVRLTPRIPVELKEGDIIRVGPFLLTFVRYVYPEPVILDRPREAAYEEPGVPVRRRLNGRITGLPTEQSTWLKYLPAIYSDDEFMGRYLLIFESMLNPIIWVIDNFDLFLSVEIAPHEWLAWMASWFDMLLLPELPMPRQREIMRQLGWLFLRRGTPSGLKRLLELYFGVTPEIIEDEVCHFVVLLPLNSSEMLREAQLDLERGREIADRLIASQKPAFASYSLRVT